MEHTDFVSMGENKGLAPGEALGVGGGKGINDLCFSELFLEAFPSS